jgi:hypothetical protein
MPINCTVNAPALKVVLSPFLVMVNSGGGPADVVSVNVPPGPVTAPSVAPAILNPAGKVIFILPLAGKLVTVVNPTVCVVMAPAKEVAGKWVKTVMAAAEAGIGTASGTTSASTIAKIMPEINLVVLLFN